MDFVDWMEAWLDISHRLVSFISADLSNCDSLNNDLLRYWPIKSRNVMLVLSRLHFTFISCGFYCRRIDLQLFWRHDVGLIVECQMLCSLDACCWLEFTHIWVECIVDAISLNCIEVNCFCVKPRCFGFVWTACARLLACKIEQ